MSPGVTDSIMHDVINIKAGDIAEGERMILADLHLACPTIIHGQHHALSEIHMSDRERV